MAIAVPAMAANASESSPTDAKRIVAIGGSITEIVFALDQQHRLIARDTTSIFPAKAEELPDVGYIRALSPEGVLSVNPDLVIALEGSGPPEAVSVLKSANVPFVSIPERFDRYGVVEKIRRTGKTLGVEHKANSLARKIELDLIAVERLANSMPVKKRIMFVLSTRGGKIMASGIGTAADGIINMAGGTNVFEDFSGYKQVSNEAVIIAAPDIILMMDRSGGHSADNASLFSHPAIATTPAAERKAVIRMNGLYLLGFGPRTAKAVRDLSALFLDPAEPSD